MPEQFSMEATQGRGAASTRASVVDLAPDNASWDSFVARSNPGSYLQTTAWAEVKAPNGWTPVRFIGSSIGASQPPADVATADEDAPEQAGEETAFGVQVLMRRPRLFPWAFAYAPRGPVLERWNAATLEAFTGALRDAIVALPTKVSHVRIEPEIELNGPLDVDGAFRHALRRYGWKSATPIQPPRTRQVDLRPDEAALWGGLRKKWR
ncbi:MAG TPA: peptidoglycan bridge formation glycyltransferase FemA/FemB family protein, partial [Candidatus Limnocylindrales bacterium]